MPSSVPSAPSREIRVNHSEAIYRHLEKSILAGPLKPGDRLDEAGLARQFGVSRTPVREAFLQLAAVELIELRARQGAIVASIPLARMAQMFEVMADLEALCASLAAQRMTVAERKVLKKVAEEGAELARSGADDACDRYFEANCAFHQVIYQGSHNEYLSQMTLNLRNRLTPYLRFRLRSPSRLKFSSQEHDAVLDAVLAGDSDRAAQEMRRHLTIQSALLADFVAALPQPDKQANG